mmetsp:Transcript_32724/g.51377  ORF Transcript_32724/g.51377 Transcript_32724/m.51377 type:complete len:223 (-) Transcript_32724:190-858(-)
MCLFNVFSFGSLRLSITNCHHESLQVFHQIIFLKANFSKTCMQHSIFPSPEFHLTPHCSLHSAFNILSYCPNFGIWHHTSRSKYPRDLLQVGHHLRCGHHAVKGGERPRAAPLNLLHQILVAHHGRPRLLGCVSLGSCSKSCNAHSFSSTEWQLDRSAYSLVGLPWIYSQLEGNLCCFIKFSLGIALKKLDCFSNWKSFCYLLFLQSRKSMAMGMLNQKLIT